MARVLDRQAIKRLPAGADERKRVEHPNRPRMLVEDLTEVRLAQPAIDARADLDADAVRHGARPADAVARYTCPNPPWPSRRSTR